MSFERPDLLWMVFVLPAIVAVGLWAWSRRRRRAGRALGAPDLLARLGAGDLESFPAARLLLLVLAAAALGTAAAGPRWGLEPVDEPSMAADLVLAMDVSRSMLARDMAPNRLEQQRVLGRRILRALPQDRIGLVAFAGRAHVLSPMTTDHGALHLYLDALDPEIASHGGTSVAAAVRQAVDLSRGPQDLGRGVVVLVSDGEALEERDAVLRATDRAARFGITIHTVGVGTPQGAPIPEEADDGSVRGFVRGPDGDVVVSRLDDALLREVARRTGGRYVRLGEPGATDELIRALRRLERTEGEGGGGVRERPRYAWFVLLALGLLAVDGVVDARSGRRRPVRPREVGHA